MQRARREAQEAEEREERERERAAELKRVAEANAAQEAERLRLAAEVARLKTDELEKMREQEAERRRNEAGRCYLFMYSNRYYYYLLFGSVCMQMSLVYHQNHFTNPLLSLLCMKFSITPSRKKGQGA